MTAGNKAYQAWKESAAGRESAKYYQAIRDYDRQQSDKQMDEEDQARAISAAKKQAHKPMISGYESNLIKKHYEEVQESNRNLDSILLGVIIGSGISTVLIAGLIAYEKFIGL